jgi:MFS transporter, ACS family, tartrate transporter
MRKVLWRIMPLILVSYFVSIADRANLGVAAIEMNRDLRFGPEVYGWGAGIFFALATAVTPVISGALLELNGVLGMHGWQWLFIVEGLPAILLAIPIFLVLPDKPVNAKWLAQDEIAWLEETVGGNAKAAQSKERWIRRIPMDLNLIVLSLMWFGVTATGYGITFFLPLIVHSLTHLTPFKTGLLSALPPAAAMVGLVVFGYTSDRFAERRWHYALSLLASTVAYVAAVWVSGATATIAALSVAAVGLYSCRPAFWALAAENMSADKAAGGLALVSALGSVGGFVGPILVGTIKTKAGSFDDALYLLAGLTAAAALIGLFAARHESPREQPDVKARLDRPML